MPLTAEVLGHPARPAADMSGERLHQPAAGHLPLVPAAYVPSAAYGQAVTRAYGRGEVIYRGGDDGEFAFVIEAGLVALSLTAHPDRDRIVALAGPGDIVGALTPTADRYLETGTALSADVRCRLLARETPAAGLEVDHVTAPGEDPARQLQGALALAAGQQLQRLTDTMADSEVAVPARVARTLVRLGDRFGHRGANGATRITLPITHDTLAAMVGAARETTTGVIQSLRERGLLDGTRGRYVFVPEELAAFAVESL